MAEPIRRWRRKREERGSRDKGGRGKALALALALCSGSTMVSETKSSPRSLD